MDGFKFGDLDLKKRYLDIVPFHQNVGKLRHFIDGGLSQPQLLKDQLKGIEKSFIDKLNEAAENFTNQIAVIFFSEKDLSLVEKKPKMKQQTNYKNNKGRKSLIVRTNKKYFSKAFLKLTQETFNVALKISELALVNFNVSIKPSKPKIASLKIAIEGLKLALVCLEAENANK
ncbi:hypothetical protein ILUMI_18445 [Ignelater luminosus]|uniref:Uncharacterized protein n=1 Tax=Ignelater luminosus TaxID=2038154 RepID=A0A8K0G6W1_IGNLU|nr:hypothetical protein ILUMI_18445 [Ignelater luminosus]